MPLFLYPELNYNTNDGCMLVTLGYGDPIPTIDAKILYEDCQQNGVDTEWWFSLANQIVINPGHEPSTCYLILDKKTIDGSFLSNGSIDPNNPGINKESPFHVISFGNTALGSVTTKYWLFHSAKAIDPTSNPATLTTAYLVKFVDMRYLLEKSNFSSLDGLTSFNMVDEDATEPETYDSSSLDDFPYDEITVNTTGSPTPWTWETLLEYLWGEIHDYGAADTNISYSVIDGGPEFPSQVPIDIRANERSPWKLFCDLLHSIGWEIYSDLDGSFTIAPIGFQYPEDTSLDIYNPPIDTTYERSEEAIIPSRVRVGFKIRKRNKIYEQTKSYHFITVDVHGIVATLPTLPDQSSYNLLEHAEISSCETIISESMSAVYRNDTTADLPENETDLEEFSIELVTKWVKARLSPHEERTYGTVIYDVIPGPAWGMVEYTSNGYQLTTKFITTKTNLSSVADSFSPSGSKYIPQLAVVTVGGDISTTYTGDASSGLFAIESFYSVGLRAVLLIHDHAGLLHGTSTIDDGIEFGFELENKDITKIQEGDVIRVWNVDGSLVRGGSGLEEGGPHCLAEIWNATDHLRRLTNYDPAPADPIVLYSDADSFYWDVAPSGGGAPGPPGATGATGPAGADGPGVDPGYAIDVTGVDPREVAFDPTEITGYAATYQYFRHISTDVNPTEPAWKTVDGFEDNMNQMWWHQSDAWAFKTTTNYVSGAVQQLFGHIAAGQWTWKTLEEWLELVDNYHFAQNQVLGHSANGAIQWKDMSSQSINNPTNIKLDFVSNTLKSELDYTPITFIVWPAASSGTPSNFQDSVDTQDC